MSMIMQYTERFTITRTNRLLYCFETASSLDVKFSSPTLTQFIAFANQERRIDVHFQGAPYLLKGRTNWPHHVRFIQSNRETLTTSTAKTIGAQCYIWKSDDYEFTIIPRKADWIVGRHWAFHLWVKDERIAYWQQRRALAKIEGVRSKSSDALQIAIIAFSFMFDWEGGRNWKY